jgi:hypothetical protein
MDHRENCVSNNSSTVACVFIATGMYLLSHCLGMIRGIQIDTQGKQGNNRGTSGGGVFSAVQSKVIQRKQLSAQD